MKQFALVATVLLSLAACGSSSRGSAEPTEPARDVSTAVAEDEPAAAAADAPLGDELEAKIAEVMALTDRMLTAFERAEGDCDRLADEVREFAHSDDGKRARELRADPALRDLPEERQERIAAEHPEIGRRFVAVMKLCAGDEQVQDAFDESGIFTKKTVETEPERPGDE